MLGESGLSSSDDHDLGGLVVFQVLFMTLRLR